MVRDSSREKSAIDRVIVRWKHDRLSFLKLVNVLLSCSPVRNELKGINYYIVYINNICIIITVILMYFIIS